MSTIPSSLLTTKSQDGFNFEKLAARLVEETINAVLDELCDEVAKSEGVYRNGYRERKMQSLLGELSFRIPKLRVGYFDPSAVLERYSRSDKALISTVKDLYTQGLSTRKIEKTMKRLGVAKLSSKSVSNMCKTLDKEIENFMAESLEGVAIPYVWLDGTYIKVRESGINGSVCLVVAVGCDMEGRKRILGFDIVDTESYDSWKGFLEKIRERKFTGTKLVVSDAHAGLKHAIEEVFLGSAWQRCTFHLIKNVGQKITSTHKREIATKLISKVFDTDNPQELKARYHETIDIIEKMSPSAAKVLEEAELDAMAYLSFPKEHTLRIRTNNVCERLNREIKRRTNAVQCFPSKSSLLRLVGAFLIDKEEEGQGKSFINPKTLEKLFDEREMRKTQARAKLYFNEIPDDVLERSVNLMRAELEQLQAA